MILLINNNLYIFIKKHDLKFLRLIVYNIYDNEKK